jgi:hypothetical protein
MRARSKDPLEAFVEAELNQVECIRRGDAPTGNKHARKRIAAARQLLAGGEVSIDRFATLLSHESPNVRVAAAAWLLKDRTEQAVAALRPIAETKGLAALGAVCTLERYAKGELEIK